MPSPSRSNFTKPIAAQSSLSHCRTLRLAMRAHSTGHTSAIGRSQMTMPPEWMPRCRGRLRIWVARSITCSGMPSTSSACPVQWLTCLLHASCWPGEKPRARAMSRTALRPR
ncbi:Uncharacterised protein [Mycobacterium tuberculosis]|uniref:Uncharacterized protein n=1 Tax=Mycobacterium tuberculosis TaxID=1773 RepID=A0A0U0SKZ5_MYCTX|nr:Uncharacterised protein [Mycobacterium tuberculosis]CFR99348.1 Uncharacterised protein [Mycobacterium tuberculosis]CKU03622.1 Uncharacterised protein [Mycobacterium tuberculosis]CKU28965.1 Uncharacterised protein [Mycobacterium tuberculosis]CKU30894.1 Uncharacterised protein [Mycobacterium tuberculosis]